MAEAGVAAGWWRGEGGARSRCKAQQGTVATQTAAAACFPNAWCACLRPPAAGWPTRSSACPFPLLLWQELDDADTKIGAKMRVLDLDNDGIVSAFVW